ncbi:hypothetical protein HC031_04355 [Planosporangium thailandense]|uniref:Uncharacterized protein n=1 Tax=Planosporangium thailandense TaxID=765197 RepID=A0ABX0XST9_9ACTN|nr:hypothetical protein [Planosporangium thailandense]NJC68962.1 hypothetical protein [Planosporangium thailandense]
MPRPLFTVTGGLLGGAGLLTGIASLAVPWGRFRVSGALPVGTAVPVPAPLVVFQAPHGTWYLILLGLLAGLFAVAALDTGRGAHLALTVAPTAGIVTVLVVIWLANGIAGAAVGANAIGFAGLRVTGEAAYGVWIGMATGPLLGFGAGALALGRRRTDPRPRAMHP